MDINSLQEKLVKDMNASVTIRYKIINNVNRESYHYIKVSLKMLNGKIILKAKNVNLQDAFYDILQQTNNLKEDL